MERGITHRDLFIQIGEMKFKRPEIFLSRALPVFQITSFKALMTSFFYVGCYLFHYPRKSLPILYTAFHCYKKKFINQIQKWKRSFFTYSPLAQQIMDEVHQTMNQIRRERGQE